MRLVNSQTKQSIVEFQGSEVIFYNKFLEREMQSIGIPIPHGLRGLFHGKDCVRLGEEEFRRAFREIYYVTAMNHDMFHWED